MCLYRLWHIQYAVMIHLSEHVKLAELDTQPVIVKSCGQHTYLEEAMKSFYPEFYANESLLSQVLCPKRYISMYLGEYPAKLWFSVNKNLVTKNTPTP